MSDKTVTLRYPEIAPLSSADAVDFVGRWSPMQPAATGMVRYGWQIDGSLLGVAIFDTGMYAMRRSVYGDEHSHRVLHLHRLVLSERAQEGTGPQFLSAALSMLHEDRPEVLCVVAYSDLCQGDSGRVHQAVGGIYTGVRAKGNLKFMNRDGEIVPTQSVPGTWPERRAYAASEGWDEIRCEGKVRYMHLLGTRQYRASGPPVKWPRFGYEDLDREIGGVAA